MNLAILIGHFPPGTVGGAELQAEAWAARLAGSHRITVITRREPSDQPPDEVRDGYRILRLPVSRLPVWRTVADVRGIARAVGRLQPRPDLLLCFQTFVSGFAGTRAGRRFGIPCVVWVRGEAEYRLRDSRVHGWLSPRVWSQAAGVLVQSEASRTELLFELERAAPALAPDVRGRLEVVENGLELPSPTAAPVKGRVLSVGRLIADKGMDVVIDGCAASGRPLTIAGDGPERAALERRAAVRGADVRFEGFVDRDRLAALYEQAPCVVLAARRGEGLPNVLLEAMARARPVVATPCAGTRDLLSDGVNGLLVPADDAGAVRAALDRLAAEPATAARLAAAGRTTAERFEWQRVMPRLEAVLERWKRR